MIWDARAQPYFAGPAEIARPACDLRFCWFSGCGTQLTALMPARKSLGIDLIFFLEMSQRATTHVTVWQMLAPTWGHGAIGTPWGRRRNGVCALEARDGLKMMIIIQQSIERCNLRLQAH
jgi:hypothetical protein